MRKKMVGLVVLVAAVVSAPQAAWWLLSDERQTLTAAEVEGAVRQELEVANGVRVDRIVCDPIVRPPGRSICDVQESDKIEGVIYEVNKDGESDLFKIVSGKMKDIQR